MGLSELHSKLLQLRLEARARSKDLDDKSGVSASRGAPESRALSEATENLWRLLDALQSKANFDPDQPRVPAGSSEGGQWTDAGGSGLQTGRSATRGRPPRGQRPPRRPRRPARIPHSVTPDGHIRVTIQPRGYGDNSEKFPDGLPELPEDLPKIPRERPTTAKERHTVVRTIARVGLAVIRAASSLAKLSPLGRVLNVFEIGHWLYEEFAPYIQAYWDPPVSLGELQQNARSPAKGYDIHHLAEEGASRAAGYPEKLIQSPENRVRISRLMHWRVTGYYMTPDPDLGWLTPRQHVARMKTFQERHAFGVDVLRKFGVAK